MAKYKVLKEFKDIKTKESYKEGQEIEMTVKRADEAIRNLKKWNGDFLERIEEEEEEEGKGEEIKKEEAKEEVKGKGK